jgi:hypothetical protein
LEIQVPRVQPEQLEPREQLDHKELLAQQARKVQQVPREVRVLLDLKEPQALLGLLDLKELREYRAYLVVKVLPVLLDHKVPLVPLVLKVLLD